MDSVVKRLAFQRMTAYAYDFVRIILLARLLEHFNIGIYAGDVLIMQRRRAGKRPFVLFAVLEQRAMIELYHLLIKPSLFRRIARGFQRFKSILQLIQVNGHIGHALPAIRAAVRNDAAAQLRRNLVEHGAHAADQRFQRVFRIGHALIRPERIHQPLVRDRYVSIGNQEPDKC